MLLPTLHNPIRLAEDTATLDVVSGGRLDVGFGRGADTYEYSGFNVDHEESQIRFQESIKITRGLWTTPEFSFSGQCFQLDQLNLVPPPPAAFFISMSIQRIFACSQALALSVSASGPYSPRSRKQNPLTPSFALLKGARGDRERPDPECRWDCFRLASRRATIGTQ